MALTRAEATELAVRRHLKSVADRGWMKIWERNGAVPEIVCHAIRTHYRVICRTYGVVRDPTKMVVYEMPEYDGHSLRH